MDELRNRIGRVKISKEIIDDPHNIDLSCIFSNFYPFSIKPKQNHYEYIGYSLFFKELEDNEEYPYYEFYINMQEMGFNLKEVKELEEK